MLLGLAITLGFNYFTTASALKTGHQYLPRWTNTTVNNSSTPTNSSSSASSLSFGTSYTQTQKISTISLLGTGLSWPAYPTSTASSIAYNISTTATSAYPTSSSGPIVSSGSWTTVSSTAVQPLFVVTEVVITTVYPSPTPISSALTTTAFLTTSSSSSSTTLQFTVSPTMPPAPGQQSMSLSTRDQKIALGVGLGVGIPVAALLFFLLAWCCFRRYKRDPDHEEARSIRARRPSLGGFTPVAPEMTSFPYSLHSRGTDADATTPTDSRRSRSFTIKRSLSPYNISRPRPSFTLVKPNRARPRERIYPEVAYLYEHPTAAVEQPETAPSSPSPPPRNPLRLTPSSTILSQQSSDRSTPPVSSPAGTLDIAERQDFATAMPAQLALALPPADEYWNDPYDAIERSPGPARARGMSRFVEETTSPIASPSSPNALLTVSNSPGNARGTSSGESGPRHARSMSWESRSTRSGGTDGDTGTLIARVDSERNAARGFVMGRWRGEPRIG